MRDGIQEEQTPRGQTQGVNDAVNETLATQIVRIPSATDYKRFRDNWAYSTVVSFTLADSAC